MLEIKNLSVLNYVNGFTFWHYKSDFTYDEIRENLNTALESWDMVEIGDMIMVSCSNGAMQVWIGPDRKFRIMAFAY